MRSQTIRLICMSTLLFCGGALSPISGQTDDSSELVYFTRRSLSGPRMGITFIPGKGELREKLEERNIGRVISQFGWHFEHRVVFRDSGPSFVIEFIPLVGGVEYGMVIPSMSLVLGIRFPSGVEFGMGPNVIIGGSDVATSALVIAGGITFDYGGVSIPVNLAFVTSPIGNRIGFVFGYAI